MWSSGYLMCEGLKARGRERERKDASSYGTSASSPLMILTSNPTLCVNHRLT